MSAKGDNNMITIATIITAVGLKLMFLGYAAILTELFHSPTR